MSWIPMIAAALGAGVSAGFQSSRSSRAMAVGFSILAAVLGASLATFEYTDAQRAALGDAVLDSVSPENLSRRHVRCERPAWECDRMSTDEHGQLIVPFTCGRAEVIRGAFAPNVSCAQLPPVASGYLRDDNEAGGGASVWILQIGASKRTFPGVLSAMGAGFLLLALGFPRLLAWSRMRKSKMRDSK
jgi:hypothetical protein